MLVPMMLYDRNSDKGVQKSLDMNLCLNVKLILIYIHLSFNYTHSIKMINNTYFETLI